MVKEKNVTVGFVVQYNTLLSQIGKSKTADDMRAIESAVKQFCTMYKDVDADAANRVLSEYTEKLHDMVEENERMFLHVAKKAEEAKSREYDFSDEKDYSHAVQSKLLQLIGQLPKNKTQANARHITNTIENTIISGIVGCRAVLELLTYPVYADMVSERQKQNAVDGSKSEVQKAFERLKETELKEIAKAQTEIYQQGFRLRNLERHMNSFQKPSAWEFDVAENE